MTKSKIDLLTHAQGSTEFPGDVHLVWVTRLPLRTSGKLVASSPARPGRLGIDNSEVVVKTTKSKID